MVDFVGGVRQWDDERTLAILRRLAARSISTRDTAEKLFALAPEGTGEITSDALHIAAEASTDGDLELARDLWLELLVRSDPGLITASAGEIVNTSWSLDERSENIRVAMTVPVPAAP
jgi:hypothetical protein